MNDIPNHDGQLLRHAEPDRGSGDWYCPMCEAYYEEYEIVEFDANDDPLCPNCEEPMQFIGPDPDAYMLV